MPIHFYSDEQLGPTQSVTPEGFLVCESVPIARTGTLLYARGEVPVEPSADGIIRVVREPEDVFSDVALASFAGKPVVNEHPPDRVTPESWRTYAIGTVLNPRRGDGKTFDEGFLYADLVITDPEAIADIRAGKREVSAGYDADYEQLAPGHGRQRNIIGNHVALVERGRCGPRCAIGDHDMPAKKMTLRDRVMMGYGRAFRTGTLDEAALVDELDKIPELKGEVISGQEIARDEVLPGGAGGPINLHIHTGGKPEMKDGDQPAAPMAGGTEGGAPDVMGMMKQLMQRLDALEQAVVLLAQDEGGEGEVEQPEESDDEDDADEGEDVTGDEGFVPPNKTGNRGKSEGAGEMTDVPPLATTGDARVKVRVKTGDSTALRDAFMDMLSRTELLVPGYRLPTFDAKTAPRETYETMCDHKRRVLTAAYKTDDGRTAIAPLLMGKRPSFFDKTMTCDAIGMMFVGASERLRVDTGRNQRVINTGSRQDAGSAPASIAEINAKNRARYGLPAA